MILKNLCEEQGQYFEAKTSNRDNQYSISKHNPYRDSKYSISNHKPYRDNKYSISNHKLDRDTNMVYQTINYIETANIAHRTIKPYRDSQYSIY